MEWIFIAAATILVVVCIGPIIYACALVIGCMFVPYLMIKTALGFIKAKDWGG